MIRSLLAALLLALCATLAHAQGGPPFITDDPATVPNNHWEINVGLIADHNPAHASYDVPNFDINYGWGNHIQLKYEAPIAAATDEHNITRAGFGESLLGVKICIYQHYRRGKEHTDENMNFSLGSYPQISLNNPTSSVRRGIVEPGPQYYLPMEYTARLGPIQFNGEVGHWFGNRNVPDRWGRGLLVGHEFSERLELYSEIYDLQDANRINNAPKQRELTADLGGRQSLVKSGKLRLLFMGGRSIQQSTRQNSQPNWIAYLGVQFEIGSQDKE